tara:strand:- start:2518 stop:3837 length:1320 start_codon:yes stop_codon:yes gene_type:complete
MAARQVAADATIEQLRTTFNTLSATDFGDISQLSSSISASNLVAAMNELEAEVAGFSAATITAQSNLGAGPASNDEFIMVDTSSGQLRALTAANLFTDQTITSPTIIFEGSTADSFETTIAVTDPTADRTITLPNATGTVSLITATETLTNKTLTSPTINGGSFSGSFSGSITTTGSIVFEGATDDSFETTLAVTDPTADRTITFPNDSGTVALQLKSFDLNGSELVLDEDGDTSIKAESDDTIEFKLVGDSDIIFTTGLIEIKNSGSQSAIRLYCESSNAHYTALQSAAHSAYAGNVTVTLPAATDTLVGRATTDTLTNKTLTSPLVSGLSLTDSSIVFEGSSANSFETTLTVVNPTADRTISLPNETFKLNSYANKAVLDGDGSTTTITVGSGYNVNQFFVTINGVDQEPTEDFTYSGTTITLDAAPGSGDRVVIRY